MQAGVSETSAASISAITRNQCETGAFVASPDFPQYQFCWLRDGSFIAYSLDRCGVHDASSRFHEWCASSVDRISSMMEAAIRAFSREEPFDAASLPPARFSLDGHVVNDEWPNFQIDGYGTWLWSLREHLHRSGGAHLRSGWARPVERTARYLSVMGEKPCFDVWEEHGTAVHTSTVAAVIAGLGAAGEMLAEPAYSDRASEMSARLKERAAIEGRFEKSTESHLVDASLLWLAEPYHVVDPFDPVYLQTATEVASSLDLDGGVRRYPTDTYYGGGAWPVLTASLGWQRAAMGDVVAARDRHEWVADRVDAVGRLAEQFGGEERDPAMYAEWVQRWGPPAKDLLWSHAMFVVLSEALGDMGRVAASNEPASASE